MKASMALFVLASSLSFVACSKDSEAIKTDTPLVISEDGAWLTRFEEQTRGGQSADALTLFESVKADHADLLTPEHLLTMATLAVEVAKSVELTQPILDYAMATYPKEIGRFGGVDAAIYRLQNPGAADQSMDGAHAPIEGTADQEADGAEKE